MVAVTTNIANFLGEPSSEGIILFSLVLHLLHFEARDPAAAGALVRYGLVWHLWETTGFFF